MATAVQRGTAVLNALADDTVDSAILLRVGNAFAAGTQASTNEEKALVFIAKLRRYIRDVVRAEEAESARAAKAEEVEADATFDIGDDEYTPPEPEV